MRQGSPARRAPVRRRRFVALLAVALLAVGAWQARRQWPGDVRSGSAAAHGAEIVRYDVRSRFVQRTLAQVAAIPRSEPSGRGRPPLLVFLHGRGSDGEESNANDAFFAALDALGADAPAVVFPNGGESSYYHDRADGRWGRARLWLDGGTEDPFREGGEALAAALGITMRRWPGEHEGDYWRAHFDSYLRFYADALASC